MPHYCFETEELRSLFLTLAPPSESKSYTFESLIEEITGFKRSVRKAVSSIERSIDLLRESLILTYEHIEYCFSDLPPTPKNAKLRETLKDYLKTSSSQDWTQAVWNAIGALKEKRITVPGQADWLFVHSLEPSFLFMEFAKAFAYGNGVGTCALRPFEECTSFPAPLVRTGSIIQGSRAELLDAVAEKIASELSGFARVLVPFFGALEEETYLKLRLRSKGLDSSKTPILPWTALPKCPDPVIAFAGKSLLEVNVDDLEFSVSELEMLYHTGFHVPRPRQIREDRLRVMPKLSQMGASIYTSIEERHLSSPFEKLGTTDTPFPPEHRSPSFSLSTKVQSYSATQLETYAICPTRYLFNNRLKLKVERKGMDGLALLNGQLTHRALELHFKSGNPLSAELLLNRFDEALKELKPPIDPKAPLARGARFQFSKSVPKILKLESELDALFGKHLPLYFEMEFEWVSAGKTFRGKIDRIDALADGSLLILDYKTGAIDFTPEHIRRGIHFQALLYLLGAEAALKKPIAGMLFYDLKNVEIRRGVLIEDRVPPEAKKWVTRGHTLSPEKYQALLSAGIEQANVLTFKMESHPFDPVPSSENCMYCDYPTLCRSAHAFQ